jgi:hypothetical protein
MLIADLSNNNNQGNLPPLVRAIKRAGFVGVIFKISQGAHFVDSRAKAGIAEARPGFNPKWLPVKRGGKLLRLNRRLWVADYGGFAVPNGYKLSDVWLHQYTASYAIPGHGKIDASRVLGKVPRLTLAQNCLVKAC